MTLKNLIMGNFLNKRYFWNYWKNFFAKIILENVELTVIRFNRNQDYYFKKRVNFMLLLYIIIMYI